MERIGTDRILLASGRVVVLSRADMPGWEVRTFRRTAILFRGGRYFVAVKERTEGSALEAGGFRYVLERWPEDREDQAGGEMEYDAHYVAARDAENTARAAAKGVRAFLLPLYPLIGLLPGNVKRRLADRYGIREDLSTALSLWLELVVCAACAALFTIHSMTGVYGTALGVRDPISWLGNIAGLAAGGLLLIAPDLVMRYSRILGESDHPWGFWEWLFRRS